MKNSQKTGLALLLIFLGILMLATPPSQAANSNSSQATPEERYVYLPSVPFQKPSLFALQGVAADYARLDYAAFRKTTNLNELYKNGVIDAAS